MTPAQTIITLVSMTVRRSEVRIILCVMLLLVLTPGVVSADEQCIVYDGVPITFDDDVFSEAEVWAALDVLGAPPMPPGPSNAECWDESFNVLNGTEPDDSGQSVADMNAEAFLDGIEWEGEDVWLWT